MSSKKKSNIKKRAQRATSNVFAMFDPNQIQEFKEAFYMIDQDKDGFITKGNEIISNSFFLLFQFNIKFKIREYRGFAGHVCLAGKKSN